MALRFGICVGGVACREVLTSFAERCRWELLRGSCFIGGSLVRFQSLVGSTKQISISVTSGGCSVGSSILGFPRTDVLLPENLRQWMLHILLILDTVKFWLRARLLQCYLVGEVVLATTE